MGEDYLDCSFIFLYILCTMSIREVMTSPLCHQLHHCYVISKTNCNITSSACGIIHHVVHSSDCVSTCFPSPSLLLSSLSLLLLPSLPPPFLSLSSPPSLLLSSLSLLLPSSFPPSLPPPFLSLFSFPPSFSPPFLSLSSPPPLPPSSFRVFRSC